MKLWEQFQACLLWGQATSRPLGGQGKATSFGRGFLLNFIKNCLKYIVKEIYFNQQNEKLRHFLHDEKQD